jgi:hypothetical protein
MTGSITMKDSSQEAGQIRYLPDQKLRVRFRLNEGDNPKRYSPEELMYFTVDNLKFVSLFNFDLYAENYAFVGQTTKIKSTFGLLLDSGSFNIYQVTISGFDPATNAIQIYSNYLFEKKSGNRVQYAAYPVNMPASNKYYDEVKDNLMVFFKDYPEIIAKIKSLKQSDDFGPTLNFMRKSN